MITLNNVKKQLQKEYSNLTRQAERLGAALAALTGTNNGNGKAGGRRTWKMTTAQRKKISIARRKQEALKKKQ